MVSFLGDIKKERYNEAQYKEELLCSAFHNNTLKGPFNF